MTNKPIISMEKVFKKYENNALALNDINVKIHKGEFVFIVGPSGAGKSTFMRMLYMNLTYFWNSYHQWI